MDRDNLRHLKRLSRDDGANLHLFLDFAPELGVSDLPDPYFGGAGGFEVVLDMAEAASRGLLAEIRRAHFS